MSFISKLNRDCEYIAPVVLTIVNTLGIVGTAIFTAKGTVKAIELINEAEKEKGEELTTVEKVKVAWKPYIPAAATAVTAIASGVSAQIINNQQKVALAGAALTLDRMYKEYKTSANDVYGEEADANIKKDIAKRIIERDPPIWKPENEQLYYDDYYGDYWSSDISAITDAWTKANETMFENGHISLAQLHRLYGLEPKPGEEKFGWSYDSMEDSYNHICPIEFRICETVLDESSSVYYIDMPYPPELNFDRNW